MVEAGLQGAVLAWWEQWGDLASVLLVLSSSWPHRSWIYVESEPLIKHQTTSYFG